MKRFYLLFKRELRLQWAGVEFYLAALLFGCFLIFISAYAFSNSPNNADIYKLAGLFWVIILFSVQLTVLQISWRSEESELEIALLPVSPTELFFARFAAVLFCAYLLALLSAAVFFLFFNLSINISIISLLALILFLSCIAQVSIGLASDVMTKSLSQKTRIISVVIAMPILFPVFVGAVSATIVTLGKSIAHTSVNLYTFPSAGILFISGFDLIFIAAGIFIYEITK